MAFCAVCNAPCRGTCAKCGARLCAAHKPTSNRARCVVCKRLAQGTAHTAQARPHVPFAPTRQRVALVAQPGMVTPPLATLDLPEQLDWIAERRTRLQAKQVRERTYLNRRAARGISTSVDDDYKKDALLEDDLCEVLDLLDACLRGGASIPTSSTGSYAGNTSFLFADPDHNQKIQP